MDGATGQARGRCSGNYLHFYLAAFAQPSKPGCPQRQRVAPEPGNPPLPRGLTGTSVRLGEPTANCEVTFEILLHGGFSFRMFFKVIHSLSRNCQWQSIRQLVINHRSGLFFKKKKRRNRKPWWKKERKEIHSKARVVINTSVS